MVFHIVLFDPRTDLREEEREAVFAAFGRAQAAIPSVRRAHVGRRVRHGAGYEAGMGEPLEYAAVLVFDDLDGLRTYLEHPAHRDVGERFNAAARTRLVYDYEVAED